MNRRTAIIVLILIALIIGVMFLIYKTPKYVSFSDEDNKISFSHPETWEASSDRQFIRVTSDKEPDDNNLLITVNPDNFFIELAGLNNSEEIKIGENTFKISYVTQKPANPDLPQVDITTTHLLWIGNGNTYWIQASGKYEPRKGDEIYNILASFK